MANPAAWSCPSPARTADRSAGRPLRSNRGVRRSDENSSSGGVDRSRNAGGIALRRLGSDLVEAFTKLPDWSGLWEYDIWVGQADGQQLSPEGMRKAKAYAAAMRPQFSPA